MLLSPGCLIGFFFPLLESTYSYHVPHTESFSANTAEFCFTSVNTVCVNSTALLLCMFIWSKSSQPVLSLRNKRERERILVWINCHLGLVTLNVMYYQSNNDNKWSQHTREQAYSQSIQTHTSYHAKMPKAESTSAVRSSTDLLIGLSSCSIV